MSLCRFKARPMLQILAQCKINLSLACWQSKSIASRILTASTKPKFLTMFYSLVIIIIARLFVKVDFIIHLPLYLQLSYTLYVILYNYFSH